MSLGFLKLNFHYDSHRVVTHDFPVMVLMDKDSNWQKYYSDRYHKCPTLKPLKNVIHTTEVTMSAVCNPFENWSRSSCGIYPWLKICKLSVYSIFMCTLLDPAVNDPERVV